MNMLAAYLLALNVVQPIGVQADDVISACQLTNTDQYRLCQMQTAGTFLGIPAQLRFITFDLMSNRRISVTYAFPISLQLRLEKAIRQHMAGAEERSNPWGHPEGALTWKNS